MDQQYLQYIIIALIIIGLIKLKIYCKGGTCNIQRNLKDHIIIITGSNSGIGLQTAILLAQQGAKIILACRDEKRGMLAEESVNQIRAGSAVFMKLDLSDMTQIRLFVNEFKKKYDRLDILINNAGISGGPKREYTKDGFGSVFGTNHLGHFLLTNLLLDLLKRTPYSRIIIVSSNSHYNMCPFYSTIDFEDIFHEKRSWNCLVAYGQSKLANVMFTKSLQRMFDKENINCKAVSLHPGGVITPIITKELRIIEKIFYYVFIYPVLTFIWKTAEQGSQTTLQCCNEEFNKLKGGEYYVDCVVKKSADESYDEKIQERLWDLSVKLVKL